MALDTEITRVAGGAKGALKTLINKLGGTVGDEPIDQYASLAAAIEIPDNQPKITVSGILKGDGEGNITAAVAGTDYAASTTLSDAKTYTDEKIAAIPTPDVSGQIDEHNTSSSAHSDIRASLESHTHNAVKETNGGLDQKFWRGTKEEFDAVEVKADDTLYIVTDDDTSGGTTVDSSSYMPSAYLATLTSAGWDATALTQTVTVPGILADESAQMIIPMPTIACMTVYNDAGIQLTNQAENALTFTADTVPDSDLQVYVSFQNVNLVTAD